MPRTTILSDVDLSHVNFDQFINSIQEKRLTALALIKSWEYEDYLYYIEGKAYKGLRLISENSCEEINALTYKPPTDRAAISLFALPISEICWLEPNHTLIEHLNGMGREYLPSTQINAVNLEKLLQKISEEGVYGYMTIYNIVNKSITNTIIFLGGSAVFAKSETLQPEANSFIWLYITEPEIASIMASAMKSIRRLRRLNISKESDFNKILASVNKARFSAILELNLCKGIKHISIYHSGIEVLSMLRRFDQLSHELPKLDGSEKELNIYVFDLESDYKPIKLNVSLNRNFTEEVDSATLRAIRDAFIQEIGPIGSIIWTKLLKEFGESLPKELLGNLIERLAKEIPDEKHRDNFLLKVKRYLP